MWQICPIAVLEDISMWTKVVGLQSYTLNDADMTGEESESFKNSQCKVVWRNYPGPEVR